MATLRAARQLRQTADDDDDGAAYNGPEPGATYDAKHAISRLSAHEQKHMASMQRRTLEEDDNEPETNPLPAHARNVQLGKSLQPVRSREHGPGVEGLCCSVNAAGDTAVVGCREPKLLVVNTQTMELMQTIDLSQHDSATNTSAPAARASAGSSAYGIPATSACTAVRYISGTTSGQHAAVVLVAKGSTLMFVHVSTAKVLSVLDAGPNKVNNVIISRDAKRFATAGTDSAVRLYDQQSNKLVVKLDHGDGVSTTGHSNDVFGLAWQDDNPNVLVSGGWDRTIQVWDVRLQRSVRSIYGPYLCGDALDVQQGAILAGSWRHEHPLELWDLGTCKLRTRLPFHQPEQDACRLYAAGFGRGSLTGHMFAGGSGTRPCVKLYSQGGDLIGTAAMPSAVNSIHAATTTKERFLAVCCAKEMHILEIKA